MINDLLKIDGVKQLDKKGQEAIVGGRAVDPVTQNAICIAYANGVVAESGYDDEATNSTIQYEAWSECYYG